MATEHDTELLTVAEAARLLKVSTVTLHRWLKAGRLPAYHVGPKAVRIRRGDLAAALTPIQEAGITPVREKQPRPIHTSIATIRPLTAEDKRRALDALEASRKLGERILARRGGRPLDDSADIIREAREERSQRLL